MTDPLRCASPEYFHVQGLMYKARAHGPTTHANCRLNLPTGEAVSSIQDPSHTYKDPTTKISELTFIHTPFL